MKNYDDLQRFKDKTRTGAIDFKDMSAQSQQQSSGNWAIIKQLASEGDEQTMIAQGGSVSTPVPQSVDARVFESSPAKPAPVESIPFPRPRAAANRDASRASASALAFTGARASFRGRACSIPLCAFCRTG